MRGITVGENSERENDEWIGQMRRRKCVVAFFVYGITALFGLFITCVAFVQWSEVKLTVSVMLVGCSLFLVIISAVLFKVESGLFHD